MITGMLIGAGIALAFFLLGRFLPSRRKGPKPVEAVCGCEHHYSMHDPGSGRCHGTASEADSYDGYGIARSWKQVPCGCRKYTGPEYLPSYVAPEIAER